MILVIGSRTDPHVVSVTRSLQRKGHDFCVLDVFEHESDGIDLQIADGVQLQIQGEGCPIEEITSVWWRQKPQFIAPAEKASDLYDHNFVAREWNHVQQYLGETFQNCYNVNQPHANIRANNKIYQMHCAKAVGFHVPRTLISNNPSAAQAFVRSVGQGRVIFKTLTPYMNPAGLLTYTTVITGKNINDFSRSLKSCPGIFQEFVEKQFELRITVVGTELFAAKINSHASPEIEIDWRKKIYDDIYTPYDIPTSFASKLIKLHKHFGLTYGAYDFVIRKDGCPIFLEVNPAGQWMWIENILGFPIGERIATVLVQGGELNCNRA